MQIILIWLYVQAYAIAHRCGILLDFPIKLLQNMPNQRRDCFVRVLRKKKSGKIFRFFWILREVFRNRAWLTSKILSKKL